MMLFFYCNSTNYPNNLNSILIVNFLILSSVLIQFNGNFFTEAKCVMRGPCATDKELDENDTPFARKWYNCLYESEPVPLQSKQGLDDFKRLCGPLYDNDDTPVCCNAEQLTILKKDLQAAEAVIGTCASCYFNFRMLWCQSTCSPNQSEFIIPRTIETRMKQNFTKLMDAHILHKINERKKQREKPKCPDDENHDEEEEENEKEKTEEKEDNISENTETTTHALDSNSPEDPDLLNTNHFFKRSTDHGQTEIVINLEYHISYEFLQNLVHSCRDIKLYGDDAIKSICGETSKSCTPKAMMDYLGLNVPERPFDIYVKSSNLTEYVLNNYQQNKNNIIETKSITIKPVKPKYHRCNETYQYGDLDYGAKCGCKECRDSCLLYDEFKVMKRKQDFKIGRLDGAAFIMGIIFFVFVAAFFKSITYFRKHRKSNDLDAIYRKRGSVATENFFSRIFNFKNRTKTEAIQLNQDLKPNIALEEINTFDMSPLSMDDINYEEKNEIFPKRISQLNILDKMKYFGEKLELFIEDKFTRLGKFCATYPGLVLTIGLAFCAIMCLGYFNFKVEKDPVKLWSADSSIARQNKKYFDENFNPFYRITQLIIEPKSKVRPFYRENITINALQDDILNEALDLYSKINSIVAVCENCEEVQTVRLEDICFQPLWPENKNCATQSIFQYWQNDEEKIRKEIADGNAQSYLEYCMKSPYFASCLSSFGGPIHPYMVAGSYKDEDYLSANAIVITYVINNYKKTNVEPIHKAMAWESEVLLLLQNYTSPYISISYTTERSIEDELERESKADIKIIAISYLMMFAYLTATLGKYSSLKFKIILLEMKIFLALAGVLLVLLSVFSSGGFFTYLGVPATLITLEVIPFLLLAVGVDNIYVMVQTYQNDERLEFESVEDQIARIVGKVGPSMLLTGTTQSAAFLISAMTPMPGVRAFSLYASLAIILNFFMQITCFVVLLTLDAKRTKAKRVDMLCCLKLNIHESEINNNQKSFLYRYFRDIYTPFLLNDYVRASIIVIFVGFFFSCISMCDKIKIGLDQKLAMPSDSYQIKYFEALQKHLKVGPPVYFVLKDGYNYSDTNLLRLLCGASNCDVNSMQAIISAASVYPNETYIAQSTVNWVDDYLQWLSSDPEAHKCCFIDKTTKKFCDIKKLEENPKEAHLLDNCIPCPVNRTTYDFPTNESFYSYLDMFLNQNPSESCVKAGHGMYGNAVKTRFNENHHHLKEIKASHFMAYHTVLSTSDDFINAMISANQISDLINKILNNNTISTNQTRPRYEVIPYSIFYVFYEQYVKIWQDATAQLLLTLIAIFICTFILLSFDLFTSLIVTGVIAIIIIDMVGIMYLWDIELNAISLVNLVIAIGISVEFSSHIARAFATSDAKNKKQRASEALYTMGPPVFSGVLQSIVGISVLAFAHSQLFQVFYFRMYFSILVLGLTHGLIFLPVLLSYIGSDLKMTSTIGRSSNKLQYLKVNKEQNCKNSPTTHDPIGQENQPISDSDQNSNPNEIFSETSLKNTSILSNDDDTASWYKNQRKEFESNKKLSSPSKTPNKMNKKNRKFYSKKSINSTNNEKSNDRDSPTSKKSVDLLLNDQNSNENYSSNSSNASNHHTIEIKNDNLNSEIQNQPSNSFKLKLNSLFKLNKEKTDGKFHKISSDGDNQDENENPYKQLAFLNNADTKKNSASKPELDYLSTTSQNLQKTPNLSIKSDKSTDQQQQQKMLSQSFNLNRNQLNSNNSIAGLIDKMNEKIPNYVSLTKLNGNHIENTSIVNGNVTSLPADIKSTKNIIITSENKLSKSDQSNLSIRNSK